MKKIPITLFLIINFSLNLFSQSLQHPVIWGTKNDRNKILTLIREETWAKSLNDQIHNLVDETIDKHINNPSTFINNIPAISDRKRNESEVGSLASDHYKVLSLASNSALLYYLTEQEKYAQFSLDVLNDYFEVLAPRTPQDAWICGYDFYDPRIAYNHIGITYDLIYPFLKKSGTRVFSKSRNRKITFNNNQAQKALANIIGNVLREYGKPDTKQGKLVSNHPILTAPGALFPILCIEDDNERERLFNVFWETGTLHQNSFTKTILPLFGKQGIWPESISYSFMSNVPMILNIVDRIMPDRNVMREGKRIFSGGFLFDNLRNPNRKFVSYGDSNRNTDNTDRLYWYTRNMGQRRNFGTLVRNAEIALNKRFEETNGFQPTINKSIFDNYQNFTTLLWGSKLNAVDGEINFQTPTVIIDHAGIALQRNHTPNNNVENGLCGIIGGAHYVHSHLTGISMELYGANWVMAPNSGLPRRLQDRKIPIHSDYYRLYASVNTVVVNGESRGRQQGSWNSNSYLWQNTTVNEAAEPEHLADPVNENFSFATQRLKDEINNADQQRTLGIIRTSPTSAYYFDVFRSKSNGQNNFHDYLYHNLGDATRVTTDDGRNLTLTSTNRYQNDVGDPVEAPGWRYFEDTKVSAKTTKGVNFRFHMEEPNKFMHMFIPKGVERDYVKGLAPPSRFVDRGFNVGYEAKKTQLMTMRRSGEAWNKAFVAIFDPNSKTSSTIKSAETLLFEGKVVGASVISEVNGSTITDYVVSNDNATQSINLNEFNLKFKGRYGVARKIVKDNETKYLLYIGEGESIELDGKRYVATETKKGFKEFGDTNPNQAPVVAIVSPANGTEFTVGQEILIETSATDPDRNLNKVNFFANNDIFKSDTSRPFDATFTPTVPGSYEIIARAIDTDNAKTDATITITVVAQPFQITEYFKIRNVATGEYLTNATNTSEPVTTENTAEGDNKNWGIAPSGNFSNIVSQESGVLRATGANFTQGAFLVVGANKQATTADSDKIWNLIYDVSSDTYRIEAGDSNRFLYHNANGTVTTVDAPNSDTRSIWELVSPDDTTLSVFNIEKNLNFVNVYPNPAVGDFAIVFDQDSNGIDKQIEMFSLSGKQILKTTTKSNNIKVKLPSVNSGLYILKIILDENKVIYTKILIK